MKGQQHIKIALTSLALLATTIFGAAMPPQSTSLPVPGAIDVIDLASDTEWTLRLDDGAPRPIKVPGGGWNSDLQNPPIQVMREVKDFVRYEREFTLPESAAGKAVRLRFGAVAHGCEVFLDGQKVGEHHGPQVAFEMDLTAFAAPGKIQALQVKAYHRRHYIPSGDKTADVAVGWDFPNGDDDASVAEANAWCHDWHGQSKVAYGICRSVDLVILPAVHVTEMFVRPSVAKQEFSADVWVRNTTDTRRTFNVGGAFSSWNQREWKYPTVPQAVVAIPPQSTVKVTLGPVPWIAGRESYWWPNIPFREDYLAQLHFLNLEIKDGEILLQRYPQRFGFVEHSEGSHYYQVNGVRVNGFSDSSAEGQVSHFDSYSSPAWLSPTGPGTGAPESWRRYMRVGINTNRLHCSPPTEYMMQAADEVGFLLIPEAPIWGNNLSRYSVRYTPQTYHDLARACRNHPSTARYSLTNEVREPRSELKEKWPWRAAIDDLREVDDIHPLVYELHLQSSGKIDGIKGGHAFIMEHYTDIHEKIGADKGIRGMGEHFWGRNSMGEFAVGARTLRVNGWCYLSGWSWLNYWPNFLQGMNHDLHAWKPQNHADRRDGIDGWNSPIVEFTRRSLDPYLVQDLDILKQNPGDPIELSGGGIQWPYQNPVCIAGRPVERSIAVFNGGLEGNRLTLSWELHWDQPDGPQAAAGGKVECSIEPGFHATPKITFAAPMLEGGREKRNLYLVLQSTKDGRVVFRDDTLCFNVLAKESASSARLVALAGPADGNWRGKLGMEGHLLVGRENEMPGFASFTWKSGSVWVYEKQTSDVRALEFFQNETPPTNRDRIAAAQYGNEVSYEMDAGPHPRRMTIYQLDWDHQDREQVVEIHDSIDGRLLDEQKVSNFEDGKYLCWDVQGNIRVTIRKSKGPNAVLSGLFLDPHTQ